MRSVSSDKYIRFMITAETVCCLIAYYHFYQNVVQNIAMGLCEGESPVTGGFPPQRRVTRSFDVFFDHRLNKRLSKQPRRREFETPSRSY